jgi:hypothetical protein
MDKNHSLKGVKHSRDEFDKNKWYFGIAIDSSKLLSADMV